jgi:Fe-S-cluster containining protein
MDSAASRLCTACGLCCNGVLFQIVKLQPADSVPALERLGMTLRRKKREPYFTQPCAFLTGCTCTIYDERPQRCRRFECTQLVRAMADPTTEAAALGRIEEARQRMRRVEACLAEAGETNTHLPLAERCAAHPEATATAMNHLRAFLEAHFLAHDSPSAARIAAP